MGRPERLNIDQIAAAFSDEAMRKMFPPIMSPQQFADLLGVSRSSIYLWISQGLFAGAVTRIGKHRRIWRDRAIQILFSRGNTTNANLPIH
jgi:excisionase family DNA binding protein